MGGKKRKLFTFKFLEITLDYHINFIVSDNLWGLDEELCVFNKVIAKLRETFVTGDGYVEPNLPNVGDTIYVLVEFYDTGNTFTRTYNQPDQVGWYSTLEEAEKAESEADKTNGFFDKHVGFEIYSVVVE